jgi:hypothetical protein
MLVASGTPKVDKRWHRRHRRHRRHGTGNRSKVYKTPKKDG